MVSVLKLSLISYEQRSMSRPDRARTRQSGKNNFFETIDDEIEIRRHVPVSVCSCSASCLASVIELVPSRQQQSLARSNDTHLPRSFLLKCLNATAREHFSRAASPRRQINLFTAVNNAQHKAQQRLEINIHACAAFPLTRING
ncbi:hypothetical protein [Methylocella sp. CPCC 101449]|uniref:hypothetical protein n=1 Tax=Methylocella sp. CPCC 101449 TaxID=2987531 RepID=UPI0028918130|nr:hypothetical protein [Methylocella sp. CPCC 101449]MDT2020389.1 hypothetical protein [Methylocella sp. CPCC 101449]HEV2574671.1 hypothetical protein [Beijerinckiaceae bacterium]